MARVKSWSLALVLLCIVLSYLVNAADENNTGGFGASFIFGDSLVDAGNNNYLPTLSRANIRPNGIDFKASGGNPTGRYTNGRTIGDIVGKLYLLFSFALILLFCVSNGLENNFRVNFLLTGEEMGVPNYAVPYLAPNSTGKAILYGVNYASGGGGVMNATGRIFVSFLSRFLPLLTLSFPHKCLWNLNLNLFCRLIG